MRQLRQAGYDVADGVDAGLGGLLRLAHVDEAAVEFDFGFLDADVGDAPRAAYGDENFLRFLFDRFAVSAGPGDFDAGFGLFDFFDLGASVDVDAAFFEDAREFFGNLFIFGEA